jgi:Phosphotransferase enzyme family
MDINELKKMERETAREGMIQNVKENLPTLISIAETFCPTGATCTLSGFVRGGYNFCIKLQVSSGERWFMRLPMSSHVHDVEEKIMAEVSTMRLVSVMCSNIPIPTIVAFGCCDRGPLKGQWYLITDELPGVPLDSVWNTISQSEELRKKFFGQLSDIVIQLSGLQFDKIGSLKLHEYNVQVCIISIQSLMYKTKEQLSGSFGRPLTSHVNDLERVGIDATSDCNSTFHSTTSYFDYLAELHFRRLRFQPNSIYDEEDGYWKFVARICMRELARRLVSSEFDLGPFVLMHGDLTQQNILVDEDYNISGIVDWEWSATVPIHLFLAIPPALRPHKIPSPAELNGPEKELFLRDVGEYLECFRARETLVSTTCPLSSIMSEDWKSGKYWFHSALMNLWDLDYPFWEYVFPRQFPDKAEEAFVREYRFGPLQSEMESLVRKKCEDLKKYQDEIKRIPNERM